MKNFFTFLFFSLFADVSAQCLANDFAALQSCFSQTGTVNITVTANISLTSNLAMTNGATYNITLGAFDIFRNGQMYTGGDASTSIKLGASTIVNGSGGLSISGLNTALALKSYVVVNPVELLFFNAVAEKGSVKLTWQTAAELNASHFDVERSVDAKVWTKIATVKAYNKPSFYAAADNTPLSIGAYYRLVQYDLDGTSEVFRNVFLETKVSKLTVYPNPTQSNVTIVSEKEVNIFDATGKIVKRSAAGGSVVSGLKTGVYIVKSGQEVARLVVQ